MRARDLPNARWVAPVLVGLVIVVAACVVAFATAPNGPGLSVDSASYELAATAFRGERWRVPLVLNGLFPPGYSATMALALGATGSARDAAVVVNILSLAATIAMVAASAARARIRHGVDAVVVPLAAALLLATSASMLRWTGYVMADVLALAAMVAAVTAAAVGVSRPRWLLAAAVAAGTAGIARHGALVTVPALAVLVPLLLAGRCARLRAAATIAIVGAATWYVGSRVLLDGPPESRRAILWHPPGLRDMRDLVDTLGAYWLPAGLGTNGIRAVLAVIVALATVALVLVVRRGAVRLGDLPPVTVLAAGMAAAHLATLAASKAWLDQAIVADDRLVLPLVPLMVLVIASAWSADTTTEPRRRAIGVGLLVVVLLAQAHRTGDWIHETRRDGIEYGQRRFATSPTLAAVRALPPGTRVWTNEVSLLFMRAEREAFPIPSRTDSYSGQPDPAFDAQVQALLSGFEDGGVAVYVDGFVAPPTLPAEELMALVPGLVAESFADGVVLRAAP